MIDRGSFLNAKTIESQLDHLPKLKEKKREWMSNLFSCNDPFPIEKLEKKKNDWTGLSSLTELSEFSPWICLLCRRVALSIFCLLPEMSMFAV